ncbi:DUF3515 family protein [Salinispora fenicalii]|uniref:DUF3515 family protein n=1 Tax=Salinispora fenicalii TaxID=1137263 RepID=UPI00048233BF|nr:DUF3515 family protein [Salinispora fenicalii]
MSRLPDSSETTTPAPDDAPTPGGDTAARQSDTDGADGAPEGGRDRSNRGAALIATAVALPATVLAGVLAFNQFAPDQPGSEPSASATTPAPLSTAAVEMAAPALAERPATVCRALLSQLPPTIRDLPQRPVTAGPEQNAAYGDPALTVACGGAAPTFADTDKLWLVNRVCWYGNEEEGSTVLSTVDREMTVTVRVPDDYDQPLQWVSPVSETIAATVLSVDDAPTGCRPE